MMTLELALHVTAHLGKGYGCRCFFFPDLSKRVQLQGTGAVSEKDLLGFEFDCGGSDHTNR